MPHKFCFGNSLPDAHTVAKPNCNEKTEFVLFVIYSTLDIFLAI